MRRKLAALALLLLAPIALLLGQAPPQAPGDVVYANQRQHRIPINIQESRRGDFNELRLFASWDQGRSWQQVAAIPPDRDAFNFMAPSDGIYWLRVAAINRQNRQEPENLYQGQPDQKMVIDTLKPLLKVKTLERQGDDVMVAWEMQEENPDWSSFRIEYQEKNSVSQSWTGISATAGLTGQARFRPTTSAPLIVRMQLRDLAGNQSFSQGEVTGAASLTARPPTPRDFPGFSNSSSANGNSGIIPASLPGAPPVKEQANNPSPMTTPTAPKDNAPPRINEQATWVSNPPVPMPVPPPVHDEKPVASTDKAPLIPPASDPAKNLLAQASRKPLPPLQYVNNPEVTVDYELSRVGPSGVGSVELWWTQNDGQSWELYAIDDKIVGATANGKHQRTVELPGDGIYGFNLVVKSRAGLGKAPPRTGDVPEMRVEVDTSPPVAQLYAAAPDPTRPNAMLFRWSAKDNNLSPAPITLEWAEKREGPWLPIGANLTNNGKHSWQLPDRAPVQAYIRLRVRDQAGNESIATTPDPQQLDLSEPEGRLINVTVSPRR